jgi:hypothetical protein
MRLLCPDCKAEVCERPPSGADRQAMYEAFADHAVTDHSIQPGADARWWAGQRGFRAWLDGAKAAR